MNFPGVSTDLRQGNEGFRICRDRTGQTGGGNRDRDGAGKAGGTPFLPSGLGHPILSLRRIRIAFAIFAWNPVEYLLSGYSKYSDYRGNTLNIEDANHDEALRK